MAEERAWERMKNGLPKHMGMPVRTKRKDKRKSEWRDYNRSEGENRGGNGRSQMNKRSKREQDKTGKRQIADFDILL